MNEVLELFIKNIESNTDQKSLIHANNIIAKIKKGQKLEIIVDVISEYNKYAKINKIKGYSDTVIKQRVDALNAYYDVFEQYETEFDSRSKWRSTILEEFMFYLFRDLVYEYKSKYENDNSDILQLGSQKAYTNFFIKAKNLRNFIHSPQFSINDKDQDFSIFRPLKIKIEDKIVETHIPAISIENKTYVDKTMLDGAIATAEKIKSGNPYSLFLVVSETWDVASRVDPAYSRIDQIYILRKSKRRGAKKEIYLDIVLDLFNKVKDHLDRDWSNIEHKIKQFGKVI